MDAKEFKYMGCFVAVKERSFLIDNGIMFMIKDTIFVSPAYYQRLNNNLKEAICEPVKVIKLDDPLDTMSYPEGQKAFQFLCDEVRSQPDEVTSNDFYYTATRFHEFLKNVDKAIPTRTTPIGNYSSPL